MAIFHFTVKIVGRSKGKSVISASAYLNGDVMKNEETGKVLFREQTKLRLTLGIFLVKVGKVLVLRVFGNIVFFGEERTHPA